MRHLLTVAFVAATAGQAIAQECPANDGWSLTVGAGGLAALTYEGDDAYRRSILPNIQVAYGDAGDSSLVQLRGSEDQATLGVFLSYTLF